jgi:hypothetical protein
MNYGRIIKGKKHMRVAYNNELKNKSLEDNIYFTLNDINRNADTESDGYAARGFSERLAGDVCYEERTASFKYSDALKDKDYVTDLLKWFNRFTVRWFRFIEINEYDYNTNGILKLSGLMKWDDWWDQFNGLKARLEIILANL